MRTRKRTLIGWGIVAVVALVAGVWGLPDTARPARAQDDWCEKYQQMVDAFNRGEPDLEVYADDMVFVGGPLCSLEECVGTDALRSYLEYLVALDTQLTITSCEVSGNTVAVTGEIRGWHEQAAGVDRAIYWETLELEGDTVVSYHSGLDMQDSQTAEWYRWWLADKPGATIAMGPGRDADQSPGTALLELYPEFSAVSVRIAAGPTGVPQPINIHEGSCADLGPVAFALKDMAGGVSQTVLEDVPGSDLQTGNLAIAVQKSEDEPDVYVACGDIPAAAEEQPEILPVPAAEGAPVAPPAPSTGSGGLLAEDGGGVAAWWYALAAGGALLVIVGLAGLGRTRSRG